MSEAAPTTCQPNDSAIAQRILEAGVKLFARKGYAATTTREIVEAAQITKPMLYYYFKSKDGLCRAALEFFLTEVERRQGAAVRGVSDPAEALIARLWVLFQVFTERPDYSRLLITFAFGPDEQVPGLCMSAIAGRVSAPLERSAEAACAAGIVRPGAAADLTMALRGVVMGWTAAALHRPDVALTQDLAARIVADLIHGFGRPTPEDRPQRTVPTAPEAPA